MYYHPALQRRLRPAFGSPRLVSWRLIHKNCQLTIAGCNGRLDPAPLPCFVRIALSDAALRAPSPRRPQQTDRSFYCPEVTGHPKIVS